MNKTPIKVLVFPAGTEIAMEIHSALKYSRFVQLFGGSSVSCHAEFVFQNYIDGFPYIEEESFIGFLNHVIDKYDIDYVYPAHDSVLMKLTENETSLHAYVVTSPLKTVEICRSKKKTYSFLKNEDYIPHIYSDIGEIEKYPVFAKPAVGQGAVGTALIENREQLSRILDSRTEYVICEYLPGKEYTVDCFTDRHGTLRVTSLRDRERIRAGIAVRTKVLPMNYEVQQIAESLNNRLTFNGAWFFQLKENMSGKLKLLEIAPRIAGTMGASRNTGVNFPLLTLYNMWGYDIDIQCNKYDVLVDSAFIRRFSINISYENIYVDFDDTLSIGGAVNTQLIMFLYQAENTGKNIYLLTKHAKIISESLEKLKISDKLFKEIICLSKEDEKYNYLTSKDSIFIDDSFSERKKVAEHCGIPVFDLDMIESLIDWRM